MYVHRPVVTAKVLWPGYGVIVNRIISYILLARVYMQVY